MIVRKSVIGISVLGVLILSASAVPGASAELRAYECSSSAPVKDYEDAHCVTNVGAGHGTLGHILLPGQETITGTNAKTSSETAAATVSVLKGTLAGVSSEVQCTGASGTGSLTNDNTEPGLSVSGTGTIKYTGCTVAKPAGKGCKVSGGAITTKELAGTTVGQAANEVKISPKEGTELAPVKIEGCSIEGLNNTFPVTGSLTATSSGATLTTSHFIGTAAANILWGGWGCGVQGSFTVIFGNGQVLAFT